MNNMYAPNEEELLEATVGHAARIWELQNMDEFPECGTLGFIMGTAFALGNVVAVYTANLPPHMRKAFRKTVENTMREAIANPLVKATPNAGVRVQ